MKLLLHTCCAPCLLGTSLSLEDYTAESSVSIDFHSYFYNPNIHPADEYFKRLAGLQSLADKITIINIPYNPEVYFDAIKKAPDFRCGECYSLRLEPTAKYAAQHGYDAFSTTLLVSPYQNTESIIKTGQYYASKYGVNFFARDFSHRFRDGQNFARHAGIYMQKYCGCTFSDAEESARRRKIRPHGGA